MLTLFRAFPTINEISIFVTGPHQTGSASTNQSRILQVDDRYSQEDLLDDSGAKNLRYIETLRLTNWNLRLTVSEGITL